MGCGLLWGAGSVKPPVAMLDPGPVYTGVIGGASVVVERVSVAGAGLGTVALPELLLVTGVSVTTVLDVSVEVLGRPPVETLEPGPVYTGVDAVLAVRVVAKPPVPTLDPGPVY